VLPPRPATPLTGLAAVAGALVGVGLAGTPTTAAALLAEAVGAPLPRRPAAGRVARADVVLDGVAGDLYDPGRSAPALVLLPGAAPKGRYDPRVQQVSRALAGAGRTVFVPDLELSRTTFDRIDIDRVVRSVVALHARNPAAGGVAVLGFSYGGSLALVAAADPRLCGLLASVATFGCYFDLVGVIQGATTGRSTVGGVEHPWRAHPQAARVMRDVALRLVPPGDVAALRAVFAGSADPGCLPPAGRAAYDLVTNGDPARTFPLAAELHPGAYRLLADFSPATVATRISAPVVALHSVDDPLVPYAELLRLRAGLPAARVMTVHSFEHVDLRGGGSRAELVRDVLTAWRFTAALLAAQEPRYALRASSLVGARNAAAASSAGSGRP
jgi:pimeloyl-ACP methyl ester carboxylesterase